MPKLQNIEVPLDENGAAFLARRSGAAVVSVEASQYALKAIIRLGLERGGQSVWFAPLSAVIARRESGQ